MRHGRLQSIWTVSFRSYNPVVFAFTFGRKSQCKKTTIMLARVQFAANGMSVCMLNYSRSHAGQAATVHATMAGPHTVDYAEAAAFCALLSLAGVLLLFTFTPCPSFALLALYSAWYRATACCTRSGL